ncbi:AAA family ATPase [Marinifilum flexuosum]|uniref:AAA family ATPase n=1 Tax=Marinifilum flexuosum TaxID=1117708 RepID=UPI0024938CDC|nr:AAA family ATPase [Marinifilum flexuosum]
MKIVNFSIENFKNIKKAEYNNLSDFIVICGGNGCGKSSILEALMTAKEAIGGYGYFQLNPNCVSADAEYCDIKIDFELNETEVNYINELESHNKIGQNFSATIRIRKNGNTNIIEQSKGNIHHLFSRYSENRSFFDYFSAHRTNPKSTLKTWNSDFLNEDSIKRLLSQGNNKFQNTKQYLTSLKMKDLQQIQKSLRDGETKDFDSLTDIRQFFNSFFAPMEFDDVYLDTNPFNFSIKTPKGTIDIDELSSGEKEVLNTYIHFHQLKPKDSIILFDEPDVHLHPELERRYLRILKELSSGNQMIITTHAPEMMIEAGSESLFTVLKYPNGTDNQFLKVSSNEQLHQSLTNVMGAKGFVSLNKKIVFIEGEESSTDVDLFEKLFPNNEKNISFIPAGNSLTVKSTAARVNDLLTEGNSFQQYYCIIDGDFDRHSDIEELENIFKLPVYHVENYLLDENIVFQSLNQILGRTNPYANSEQVKEALKEIALEDVHLLPYTRAMLDSKVYSNTELAKDMIYQKRFDELKDIEPVTFAEIRTEAQRAIEVSIEQGEWNKRCKGRELIKGLCNRHGLNYEQFRNILISNFSVVPRDLSEIVDKIIE